jgi:hypothetical protein
MRTIASEGDRDTRAEIVADDVRLLVTERVEHLGKVARKRGLDVVAIGHRRRAHPALLRHDDRESLSEGRRDRVPHQRMLREAVQQHHRRARAADAHSELRLADVDPNRGEVMPDHPAWSRGR